MVTALRLGGAGDGLGVRLGEPVPAGLGFACLSEVDDQLSGVVVVLHDLMMSV